MMIEFLLFSSREREYNEIESKNNGSMRSGEKRINEKNHRNQRQ